MNPQLLERVNLDERGVNEALVAFLNARSDETNIKGFFDSSGMLVVEYNTPP